MTKAEQARILAWRLKVLRYSQAEPRQVARTCRHFGISRTAFYRWKRRYDEHGEAALADRPRAPLRSPRETPRAVVSKILYLRQQYPRQDRRLPQALSPSVDRPLFGAPDIGQTRHAPVASTSTSARAPRG